ncbi:MAG: HAD-IA family hydrolase [bacterium]
MKKKSILALIYDLDGTLIDSRRDLCIAANVMRSHFGLSPISEETIRNYIGLGVKHLVSRALDGKEALYAEGFDILRSYYAKHLTENTLLFEGVVEILEYFKHKMQFVLSNKLDTETKMIIQQLNISRYFTEVIGDIDGIPIKPDPAKLLAIMDKYSIVRQDAVMVGDSSIDIETGYNAGVNTVFINGGIGKRGTIEPDIVVDRIVDLKDYFT